MTSGGCGTTLAAGASCIIRVRFLPTVGGAATANLRITDNSNNVAGTIQNVGLSGTGTIVANNDDLATPASTSANVISNSFNVRANDLPNAGTVAIVPGSSGRQQWRRRSNGVGECGKQSDCVDNHSHGTQQRSSCNTEEGHVHGDLHPDQRYGDGYGHRHIEAHVGRHTRPVSGKR